MPVVKQRNDFEQFETESGEASSRGRITSDKFASSNAGEKTAELRGGSSSVGQQAAMVRLPVLVECPACETKFTVSRAALNGADGAPTETPTFHCSRCDFVFSRSQAELIDAPTAAPSARRTSQARGTQPLFSISESIERGENGNGNPNVDRFAPRSSTDVLEAVAQQSETPGIGLGGTRSRQLPLSFNAPNNESFGSRGAALSEGNAARKENSVTQSATQMSRDAANRIGSGRSESGGTRFSEHSVQLKDLGEVRSSPLAESKYHALGTSPEKHATGRSWFRFFSRASRRAGGLTGRSGEETYEIGGQYASLPELSRTIARKIPIATLVAPMIGALLILAFVSWLSVSVPTLGGWMSAHWVGRTETALGHGLVLRGVTYSKLTLENGTQIGVITGSVYNGSGASIERATLEGVTFGPRGEELSRIKTALGNRLNKAKVQSLTAEMISDLQSERRARNVTVRPGEGQQFVIALPLAANARSFSARILNAK